MSSCPLDAAEWIGDADAGPGLCGCHHCLPRMNHAGGCLVNSVVAGPQSCPEYQDFGGRHLMLLALFEHLVAQH